MSVYVDDMEARYGRMIMCHMIADTHQELVEMAHRIGVSLKWIHREGTGEEHLDICKSRRAQAVALGAKEITMRELGRKCIERSRIARFHAVGS